MCVCERERECVCVCVCAFGNLSLTSQKIDRTGFRAQGHSNHDCREDCQGVSIPSTSHLFSPFFLLSHTHSNSLSLSLSLSLSVLFPFLTRTPTQRRLQPADAAHAHAHRHRARRVHLLAQSQRQPAHAAWPYLRPAPSALCPRHLLCRRVLPRPAALRCSVSAAIAEPRPSQ